MGETLTEFLLARFADDERLAKDAASEGTPHRTALQLWTSKKETTPGGELLGARGSVEASPARVLAECEAKRRIVEEHGGRQPFHVDPCDAHNANQETVPCDTIRLLALPYADHPDYQQEWKS